MHEQSQLPATLLGSTAAILAVAGTALAGGGTLGVVSVDPVGHSLTAPTGTAITIRFDRAVDPETFGADDFWMFGRWSGTATGPVSVTTSTICASSRNHVSTPGAGIATSSTAGLRAKR